MVLAIPAIFRKLGLPVYTIEIREDWLKWSPRSVRCESDAGFAG